MGFAAEREILVNNINRILGPANIANAAAQARQLSARADFLTISRVLGILPEMSEGGFRRYRRNLPFPRLVQQVLTSAHRAALMADPPIPLHIAINDVAPPSVQVTATPELISVVLNRPDPQPRPR